MAKEFFGKNDLNTLLLKIKDLLTTSYVGKAFKTGSSTEYKVLSDNNLTDALVTKINNAGDSSFSGNYNDLTNKPTIPSKTSQLTNDSGYQTSSQVETAITGKGYQTASQVNSAISSAVSTAYKVKGSCTTAALPESGQAVGDVWNLTDAGTYGPIGTNVVWTGSAWDALGGSVDLSGYLKDSDVTELTSSEIDTIWNGVFTA